jgi:asparagine synthase (glutamine-hydrolysing)
MGAQDVLQWYSRTLSAQARMAGPRLWSEDIAERLRQEEPWEESLHARKLARRAAQFTDVRQSWYYLDLHLRLPDLLVSAVQQLALQEQMVVRSPYLHIDVMQMLAPLPFVLDDGTEKSSLSTVLAQRYLVEGVGRAKLPLVVPARSLLRGARSELVRQMLSPEAVRASGIFDMEAVEGLLKQQEVSRELLLVFTTQLLCQLFGIGM